MGDDLIVNLLMIHEGGDINADLLLASFLPVLLFESTFSMDAHQIKVCAPALTWR